MKRISILFTAVFVLLAGISFSSVKASNSSFSVGATLKNFTLSDTNGASKSLNDLKGKKGTVVIFLSAQCPVVRGYNKRINEIAADYQAKGINFIGINSNSTESMEMVKAHAAENYKFPVLIDKGNVLADKLGANATPEVFYLDAENTLLYHGAIDNDRSGQNITENYLRTAFDASLEGKKIEKTNVNAFGCSIKRAN